MKSKSISIERRYCLYFFVLETVLGFQQRKGETSKIHLLPKYVLYEQLKEAETMC